MVRCADAEEAAGGEKTSARIGSRAVRVEAREDDDDDKDDAAAAPEALADTVVCAMRAAEADEFEATEDEEDDADEATEGGASGDEVADKKEATVSSTPMCACACACACEYRWAPAAAEADV